ncbi:sugar kinase [uncultured Thalassospira sp.]|uniref:sugar kinase n=1 Tax=uncultured Thalassospira sp. TaxID=404382 RepID=UPI0030DB08D4|tara:strand:+ start:10932 stop:11933 length:1002 start_codon:yes stop_codon:yes gene_type:complete
MTKTAFIGECMIEISAASHGNSTEPSSAFGPAKLSYAGDTLNAAVYMARVSKLIALQGKTKPELSENTQNDAAISYVTALGTDPYSQAMMVAWQNDGLDTSLVRQIDGELPGLYAIQTDASGERSFSYWRQNAAARQLFKNGYEETLGTELAGFGMVYLSGISLAILDTEDRAKLFVLLASLRKNGTRVCFDSNHRPRLWADTATAKNAYANMAPLCDILMPTFDDEATLFGDATPLDCAKRWRDAGAGEVIVKNGALPTTYVTQTGETGTVTPPKIDRVIDTTSAGDSFNGSYLAARNHGIDIENAITIAQKVAGCVISARGALVDINHLVL